ncbi:hypothetical protein A6U92_22975 [Agrobacterium rubi]|nr:hypothetical protein A6U92_22975 [Agrobacterium rubi]
MVRTRKFFNAIAAVSRTLVSVYQTADTSLEAGICQNVTEGTGVFIFACGKDDDVAGLCVVDGELQHDVIAGTVDPLVL